MSIEEFLARMDAELDFRINDVDMTTLRHLDERDYGDSSSFPVYSGR